MGRPLLEIVCERYAGFAPGRLPLSSPTFLLLPKPTDSTPSALASLGSPAEAPLLDYWTKVQDTKVQLIQNRTYPTIT